MTRLRLALGFLTAVALVAVPATAEVFTIKLQNGSIFESRYQPMEADWDPEQIVFVDELGMKIALAKADVESVTSAVETSGFGTVIDSTTIDLGFLPNDMPTEEELQAGDPRNVIQRMLDQQQLYDQQPSYDQQQFVEPSATGGGIPVTAVPSSPSTVVVPFPGQGGG